MRIATSGEDTQPPSLLWRSRRRQSRNESMQQSAAANRSVMGRPHHGVRLTRDRKIFVDNPPGTIDARHRIALPVGHSAKEDQPKGAGGLPGRRGFPDRPKTFASRLILSPAGVPRWATRLTVGSDPSRILASPSRERQGQFAILSMTCGGAEPPALIARRTVSGEHGADRQLFVGWMKARLQFRHLL